MSPQILNSFRGVEGRLQEVVFRTSAQNYYELMMNVIQKNDSALQGYFDEYGIKTSDIVNRTYNMTNMYTNLTKKTMKRLL